MDSGEFERHLAAAKQGDEAAFVALFRSIQPALLRYLRTLGGSLAEDAAAETWLSVVRGLDRFAGDEAGWRAWVLTIGRARLRDAQRKEARTPVPVDVAELFGSMPDDTDVDATVEEMFSTESALRLIGTLPQIQAETVLLRYVAGLDVPRTAEVLGRRPGAVRVAAHRALRRLADLLADDTRRPAAGSNARARGVDY